MNIRKDVCLFKRDIYRLLYQRKKWLVYILSVFVLDIVLVSYGRIFELKREIIGITVFEFNTEPEKLPIQWIWGNIGIVYIFMDCIKADIKENASYILPRIKSKVAFWNSKMVLGIITAAFVTVYDYVEKNIIMYISKRLGMNVEIKFSVLTQSMLFFFLGAIFLCWSYSLITLLTNELLGFIFCIICVVSGFNNNIPFMYSNCFMYVRTCFLKAVIAVIVCFTVVFIFGKKKMVSADIV